MNRRRHSSRFENPNSGYHGPASRLDLFRVPRFRRLTIPKSLRARDPESDRVLRGLSTSSISLEFPVLRRRSGPRIVRPRLGAPVVTTRSPRARRPRRAPYMPSTGLSLSKNSDLPIPAILFGEGRSRNSGTFSSVVHELHLRPRSVPRPPRSSERWMPLHTPHPPKQPFPLGGRVGGQPDRHRDGAGFSRRRGTARRNCRRRSRSPVREPPEASIRPLIQDRPRASRRRDRAPFEPVLPPGVDGPKASRRQEALPTVSGATSGGRRASEEGPGAAPVPAARASRELVR